MLAGSIALSFIVIMSFGDFLRFNWNLDIDNPGERVAVDGRQRRGRRVGIGPLRYSSLYHVHVVP